MLIKSNGVLYLGFDNTASGTTIFRASTEVDPDNSGDGEAEFTQQANAGFGQGALYPYIFSSAIESKFGKNYIYVTVGDGAGSIKVLRAID